MNTDWVAQAAFFIAYLIFYAQIIDVAAHAPVA
ncbi:hypothetical protein YPC_3085 [Yersinia pestis biovar Medievalis str. Harbin 35]|uniref:Uncharacterized protein n=1 Tax=Yersinia pseudotuberculosis serotype O:3 (strain YPIII) TaxID=502800 RepID=A0A0H3B326_YERPY|nr:hypothetical protein YPC_3085 [Yersinia pestis biovar Medievalis str. Harbin 35]EEO77688.1 hypothetical protein YP516_1368 [Yersinia pestis Nepal516]EEO80059.1 hypothetical protein YPF_3491 [Yersinia pestis biovar Orientalis str. India 195]EEO84886.1 hypothetical protein YPH_0711 [Yersinia pestis biovar Orientalis str. PEXU2]EEO89312.1 hypothetical protein YPS_3267 [Yersinia pestis Pestoides A]